MAIITKIRDKSWLIVGFVGVAMLAFILGDYNRMFGDGEGKYGIGLIGGEKISIDRYNALTETFQFNDRKQKEQENKPYTDEDISVSNDKAFNFLVDSTLLSNEYNALNIDVSEREFNAYLLATNGFNPIQEVNQYFVDKATGAMSEQSMKNGRAEVQKIITQLKSSKKPEEKSQWEQTKKALTDRRKNEKYFSLVSQGLYVTKVEAREEYLAKKEIKNIQYVTRKYTDINDAEIKVTEEEIREYYEAHKGDRKYANRTNNRKIKLLEIPIKPSKIDTLTFDKLIAKLRVDFMNSKNDSALIVKESEIKQYFPGARGIAVPMGHPKANQYLSYPMDYDTIIKRTPIGQLVGPYRVGESFHLSKLIGFSPSKMKARHLLIATNQSKDSTILAIKKKTADSLLNIIDTSNFSELVKKFSDDPGSKDKGGVLEDFLEGDMVKEFGNYCATAEIGKISIVKTDYGYHIIEVLERDPKTFPILNTIVKSFKPSEPTISNAESSASMLLGTISQKLSSLEGIPEKIKAFDKMATSKGYAAKSITMEDNNPMLNEIATKTAKDRIFALAYNEDAAIGSLVDAPIRDKDKYIIALLCAIREIGEPEYYEVKEDMRKELIIDKKAKRIINEMSKYKQIDAVAKKYNIKVEQAQLTFGSPSIGDAGFEPEIVGALFSGYVKDGQMTLPLKGKSGVYLIKLVSTQKAPATAVYKEEKQQMLSALKGRIGGDLIKGLRKSADVVDNRNLFPNIRT
jgi:peptidyl-prolyl cis-trans isomerase D